MSEIHIEAEFPLEVEYPLEIIWRDLFRSIFSNIGRIAALGNCRNAKTGEYRSSALELHLASAKADRSMRLAHELLWNNWIRGSLEQQRADIRLYCVDISMSIERVLSSWIESLPALALAKLKGNKG